MTVKSALSSEEHLSIFRDATVHLEKMTTCLHVFWEPDKVQNLRALHNNYDAISLPLTALGSQRCHAASCPQ